MVEELSKSESGKSPKNSWWIKYPYIRGFSKKIVSFCPYDWAILWIFIALFFLLYYAFDRQPSQIIQVVIPFLTILVAVLIMLKSARSTILSTDRHVKAIQDSTKIQIDSAMDGFDKISKGLNQVIDRLDKIYDVAKKQSDHDIREAEKAKMAVQPRLFTTLQTTGWWLWRNYQLKIEIEENDAKDATIKFTSFNPQTRSLMWSSLPFIKLTRKMPVFINCGSASGIEDITRRTGTGIRFEITFKDSLGNQYSSGPIEITLENKDRRIPMHIT